MTQTVLECARRGIRWAALLLLIIALSGIAGCGRRAAILGTEPFDRVAKVGDDLAALEAWVESGQKADLLLHIDMFDDIAIVPPSLEESMKNAADHLKHGNTKVIYDIAPFLEMSGTLGLGARAGLYDRIVWIFPVRRSINELGLDAFKNFLMSARGYRASDLTDLAVRGTSIEGTLAGVPVTVTTIEDFDPGDGTAIVDIDLAYFSGMQAQDPQYELGTASLLDFLNTLKEKELGVRFATITLSDRRAMTPVGILYMADLMVESFRDPQSLIETPEKWNRMIEAEALLREKRVAAADSLYARLLEEHPDDAGLRLKRGVTQALLGRGEGCAEQLTEAHRIDGEYLQGFFQIANLMARRGQLQVAEQILSAPVLGEAVRANELNYNMGIMYIAGGKPERALPLLEAAAQFDADNVDLALMIYRTARDAGATEEMRSSLERLVEIDRQLIGKKMPWVFRELGNLYKSAGEKSRADRMYRFYIEAAPNDSAAVELKKTLDMDDRLYLPR